MRGGVRACGRVGACGACGGVRGVCDVGDVGAREARAKLCQYSHGPFATPGAAGRRDALVLGNPLRERTILFTLAPIIGDYASLFVFRRVS
ncbi:hypothetical protein RR48_02687 [Papilio machaon]|uniref:Uncharacterized protein n=1 Tax=Papilio machaon TaxID=76193 RepID=A0A0N1IHH0_PAPMA|nr:hypothetical protein RR48_02687 [Papilio machaon]